MFQLGLGSTVLTFDKSCFSVMTSVSRKETFPWWGVGFTLACGYKDKYLESCWLSTMAVVGIPPRSMMSLALGSWLGVQSHSWCSFCWRGWGSLRQIIELFVTSRLVCLCCTLQVFCTMLVIVGYTLLRFLLLSFCLWCNSFFVPGHKNLEMPSDAFGMQVWIYHTACLRLLFSWVPNI